jgi:hypothetical protein
MAGRVLQMKILALILIVLLTIGLCSGASKCPGCTYIGNISMGGIWQILGGTTTTSDLTFKTTSAVGTTGADMHFLVGSNGTTEAMTILNNGRVGYGTAAPSGGFDSYATDTYFGTNGADNNLWYRGFNGAFVKFVSNTGFSSSYNGFGIVVDPTNVNSYPSWGLDIGGNRNAGPDLPALQDTFSINRKASGGSWVNFLIVKNTGVIGIGTDTPDATARLDITSTTQGFL